MTDTLNSNYNWPKGLRDVILELLCEINRHSSGMVNAFDNEFKLWLNSAFTNDEAQIMEICRVFKVGFPIHIIISVSNLLF